MEFLVDGIAIEINTTSEQKRIPCKQCCVLKPDADCRKLGICASYQM